jgi:hypothetical protein
MDVAGRVDAPGPRGHGNRAGGGSWTYAGGKWPRWSAFLYLALLGGSALALTLYVASEDDYRRGGIGRWHAYDAQELTVAGIATTLAAAAVLINAASGAVPGLRSSIFSLLVPR